jgi:hypothetical protein
MKYSTARACSCCDQEKTTDEFYTRTSNGKQYLESYCKTCSKIKSRERRNRNITPEKREHRNKRVRKWYSDFRKSPENRPRCVLRDSKQYDKRNGYHNDLDLPFIENELAKGCFYCEETEIQITLDRIDNNKGHSKDNVTPSCIRCNLIRRNMPYDAWVVVAEAIKIARMNGLFGMWTGRIHENGG